MVFGGDEQGVQGEQLVFQDEVDLVAVQDEELVLPVVYEVLVGLLVVQQLAQDVDGVDQDGQDEEVDLDEVVDLRLVRIVEGRFERGVEDFELLVESDELH